MRDIVFSSDIDGIFNNYPACFLDFIFEDTGEFYATIMSAKELLTHCQYENLKKRYRQSEFKYSLPFQKDALAFYQQLNKREIKLIFSTSRPFKQYPGMFVRTENWLKSSGIKFEALVPKNVDSFEKHSVTHHIDDEESHAAKLVSESVLSSLFVLKRDLAEQKSDKSEYTIINSFDSMLRELDFTNER
jgi:hypothetical protein